MTGENETHRVAGCEVLCVALWRTRPSVLFVLEARFSAPIDKTPCFNANPHRRSSPYAMFPTATSPPPPLPLYYLALVHPDSEILGADIWMAATAGAFWKIDVSSIKRYFIPRARREIFPTRRFVALDRPPGNNRKPATIALTTLVIDTAMSNWQEQYRIPVFGKGERRRHFTKKFKKLFFLFVNPKNFIKIYGNKM